MKEYDVVVIGAGPGGYQAALELGNAGVKTLLIERAKERIGGVCLNEGCIPAKNYLQSASFASSASYYKECGVLFDMKGLDLQQLQTRTTALKNEIRSGVLWMLEQAKVELLFGSAVFVDANTVEISGESIRFKNCIIATGSKSRELPQLPFDGKKIISSSDLFELKSMPKSIAIVGVGSIGCEAATFFNAFGVEVTLIGRGNQLLSQEDEDISKALLRAFKKRNINVLTSAAVSKAEIDAEGVTLFIDGQEKVRCEVVLSAAGRIPNVEEVHLEKAGVVQNAKGFIEVSSSFKSSQQHIYAVGDCIDTPAYAHTAYAEAKIAARNIIDAADHTNTRLSPSAVFSDPAVASCGLNEKMAKESGVEIEVKKALFKVNSKAKIHGDDSGFAKVIVSTQSGVILGASVIGVEATEIIHELSMAVEKGLTYKEVKEMIHIHPSVSEIISYL